MAKKSTDDQSTQEWEIPPEQLPEPGQEEPKQEPKEEPQGGSEQQAGRQYDKVYGNRMVASKLRAVTQRASYGDEDGGFHALAELSQTCCGRVQAPASAPGGKPPVDADADLDAELDKAKREMAGQRLPAPAGAIGGSFDWRGALLQGAIAMVEYFIRRHKHP